MKKNTAQIIIISTLVGWMLWGVVLFSDYTAKDQIPNMWLHDRQYSKVLSRFLEHAQKKEWDKERNRLHIKVTWGEVSGDEQKDFVMAVSCGKEGMIGIYEGGKKNFKLIEMVEGLSHITNLQTIPTQQLGQSFIVVRDEYFRTYLYNGEKIEEVFCVQDQEDLLICWENGAIPVIRTQPMKTNYYWSKDFFSFIIDEGKDKATGENVAILEELDKQYRIKRKNGTIELVEKNQIRDMKKEESLPTFKET